MIHNLPYSFNVSSTYAIPIELTDTGCSLPSDDPNVTNLMVSHNYCKKQHSFRQFILLNLKQCTEAPSNIQHANVKARVYVRVKTHRVKAFKCEAYAKKKGIYVFKVQVNTDVWKELYGIITKCHFLLHVTLYNEKI